MMVTAADIKRAVNVFQGANLHRRRNRGGGGGGGEGGGGGGRGGLGPPNLGHYVYKVC